MNLSDGVSAPEAAIVIVAIVVGAWLLVKMADKWF